jgi:hypothetical protein
MELDWRNRCVGGERLEDLLAIVHELDADDDDDLYNLLWHDPHVALPFHRALLRVAAELLWERAARLASWHVIVPDDDFDELMRAAFDELLRRAGIEFDRAGI